MSARRGSGRFAYSPDIRIGAALTLQWSEHRADQAPGSYGWAATDRGWFNAAVTGSEVTDLVCLGHYLDYPHSHSAEGTVYAVSCVSQSTRFCRDVIEARLWLETEARGREVAFAAQAAGARAGLSRSEVSALETEALAPIEGAS